MALQIAFIDTRLADWRVLTAALDPGVEVILLDPNQDGLLQIATARSGRNRLNAIHIFSHGDSTRGVTLTTLNAANTLIAGIGDFDGNGKADILWRNSNTGANTIWKGAIAATPNRSLPSATRT